jgi:hypothetical protein
MKRALTEKSFGTSSDASGGFVSSPVGADLSDGDRARTGGGKSEVGHVSSSTFEAWLAGYRSRLEQLVKNARPQ